MKKCSKCRVGTAHKKRIEVGFEEGSKWQKTPAPSSNSLPKWMEVFIMATFKAGDIVRLKSGSPKMTVD
jgi:hypothetical protein